MKFKKSSKSRRLVAVIKNGGSRLLFRLDDGRRGHAALFSSAIVWLDKPDDLEENVASGGTPVFEGDTVEIEF